MAFITPSNMVEEASFSALASNGAACLCNNLTWDLSRRQLGNPYLRAMASCVSASDAIWPCLRSEATCCLANFLRYSKFGRAGRAFALVMRHLLSNLSVVRVFRQKEGNKI